MLISQTSLSIIDNAIRGAAIAAIVLVCVAVYALTDINVNVSLGKPQPEVQVLASMLSDMKAVRK